MSIKTVALKEKLGNLDLHPAPVIVEESTPYKKVIDRMRVDAIGCAVVCRDGKVTGIFTERDVLNKTAVENIPARTPIGKLMTSPPLTTTLNASLGQAIELMRSRGVRNLPLVDSENRPVGLLTVGRMIRYLADHFPAEVVNLPPVPDQVSSEAEGA
ncbi:MAG: CBS domain-containing protein [Elusimicrobia bacterium]|nr:CBS domain-containing protein [Elusimicrobiota bacterium]